MTIDERARHELFLAAERALGSHQSETLMELLPPVGWADVATNKDLTELEERIALRFEVVDQRFDSVDQRLASMDSRLDTRFEAVDQRLASMDARLDTRFEVVDQRFEMVDLQFDAQSAHLLGELDRRFAQQTRTLFLSLSGMAISLTTVLLTVLLVVR